MPKLTHRVSPLNNLEQKALIEYHIRERIKRIQATIQITSIDYVMLAGAFVLTRSIAHFLGLRISKGRLCEDHNYFHHEDCKSWEVKLSDIDGGSFVQIASLSAKHRSIIEDGFKETNLAFAHLTFWSDPANQDSQGRSNANYHREQVKKLRAFADTIIQLFYTQTVGLPKCS